MDGNTALVLLVLIYVVYRLLQDFIEAWKLK